MNPIPKLEQSKNYPPWLNACIGQINNYFCSDIRSKMIAVSIARAENYNKSFPDFPPLYVFNDRIEGLWIMGNNYRTSGYHGAYPHGYLKRVLALFPDVAESEIIHVCSGSLPPGEYTRVDINPDLKPDFCCNAEELSGRINKKYQLALVDVPYTGEDAERYGFPMLSRKKVLAEIHKILNPGGWVVWLDQMLPMFSKKDWEWKIAIGMIKSTNHRARAITGFQKKGNLL